MEQQLKDNKNIINVMCIGLLSLFAADAIAGTTGVEFKAAYDWVVGGLQGYGGKLAAVIMALIGVFIAAITKSLIAPLGALGLAFIIAYIVNMINGIATAII